MKNIHRGSKIYLVILLLRCASLVNSPTGEVRGREGANLSKAYLGLVTDLWKTLNREDGHYIAPTKVSLAIKTAQPMFRGFHQHDAQVSQFYSLIFNSVISPIYSLVTRGLASITFILKKYLILGVFEMLFGPDA